MSITDLLKHLVDWSKSLKGKLITDNEALNVSVPPHLESWLRALRIKGFDKHLASWLTYTYNGTLQEFEP